MHGSYIILICSFPSDGIVFLLRKVTKSMEVDEKIVKFIRGFRHTDGYHK